PCPSGELAYLTIRPPRRRLTASTRAVTRNASDSPPEHERGVGSHRHGGEHLADARQEEQSQDPLGQPRRSHGLSFPPRRRILQESLFELRFHSRQANGSSVTMSPADERMAGCLRPVLPSPPTGGRPSLPSPRRPRARTRPWPWVSNSSRSSPAPGSKRRTTSSSTRIPSPRGRIRRWRSARSCSASRATG